jgi:hypothetical protein
LKELLEEVKKMNPKMKFLFMYKHQFNVFEVICMTDPTDFFKEDFTLNNYKEYDFNSLNRYNKFTIIDPETGKVYKKFKKTRDSEKEVEDLAKNDMEDINTDNYFEDGDRKGIKMKYRFQFILLENPKMADVVSRFDFYPCRVIFNGNKTYFTEGAVIAFKYMVNVVNDSFYNTLYDVRLLKYLSYGFKIVLPKLNNINNYGILKKEKELKNSYLSNSYSYNRRDKIKIDRRLPAIKIGTNNFCPKKINNKTIYIDKTFHLNETMKAKINVERKNLANNKVFYRSSEFCSLTSILRYIKIQNISYLLSSNIVLPDDNDFFKFREGSEKIKMIVNIDNKVKSILYDNIKILDDIFFSERKMKIINEIKDDWQRILSVVEEELTTDMCLIAIESIKKSKESKKSMIDKFLDSDSESESKYDSEKIIEIVNHMPKNLINDDFCLSIIKDCSLVLEHVKVQTPEICLAAVKKNGNSLKFVKVQTPEICLAAVQQKGWALEFVKKQTPEICLAAVQKEGYALRFVKKQTPEICLAAVKNYGVALGYVKKQTIELCLAAIEEGNIWGYECINYIDINTPEICLSILKSFYNSKRHYTGDRFLVKHYKYEENLVKHYNNVIEYKKEKSNYENEKEEELDKILKYIVNIIIKLSHTYIFGLIKEQTPEICLSAVKHNGYVLEHIKNQTPEICLAAVQKEGYALEYVKNRTPEICLAAVQNNTSALQFVENQTHEMCLAAVKKSGCALKFVKDQTPEICLAAVQNWGFAIDYVKNQTPEICLAAVKENYNALKYVKEQTPEICLIASKSKIEDDSDDEEEKPIARKKRVQRVLLESDDEE